MYELVLPADLQADLQLVEAAILEQLQTRSAVVAIAGKYLTTEGRPRLRAVLALLAARLGTYDIERVVHVAASVELIQTAALVHAELVDEADRRRGNVAVHDRWEHGVNLMVGDFFFALAAGEMARAPDPRVLSYLSQAVMYICEGELAPVMQSTPFDTARDQYYYKSGNKTAALFAAACRSGIACSYGSDEQIEHLDQFGHQLGLAFQIVADTLDYTDNKAGHALRRGIITLPLIHAVAAGGGERLAAAIDTQDPDERAWALTEVRRLGVEPALAAAEQHATMAREQLAFFPDSPTRLLLNQIVDYVLQRES